MENKNLPAFPVPANVNAYSVEGIPGLVFESGLTKREYFAAMAMQGICLGILTDTDLQQFQMRNVNKIDAIAKMAKAQADALLAELEK